MSALLDKAIAAGLLIAVVFTALAFGAVEAWSVAIFNLIIALLLLLWAAKVAVDGRVAVRIPAAALPLAAFLLLGVAQSITVAGGDGRLRSFSTDAEATRAAVTVLFFLIVSFMIASNFFATRERLKLLAGFLVIYGLAMALFSLVQHFSWDGRIYGLRASHGKPVGPFVNRNHFAGYMEMLAPMPIALIVSRIAGKESWAFHGFIAAVTGLALVVSLSRAGILSLAAGMIFILIMSARFFPKRRPGNRPAYTQGQSWLKAGAVLAIALAITIGSLWVGAESLIYRAATTIDQLKDGDQNSGYFSRAWIWRDSWSVFVSNPLLGTGLGAFQTIYPAYGHGDGSQVVAQSHNDYLQVLVDTGIIGGVIAILFLALTLRTILSGMKAREPLLAGLALGSGAGIFAMLVHSFFDFNLQLPSNALMFLILISISSTVASLAKEPGREYSTAQPAHSHDVKLARG